MKDPALEGIDKTKLEFLEKLFAQSASVDMSNQKEMLPFLLSLTKLARERSISFDKDEFTLIYSVLQKYSSRSDIDKMQKMASMLKH